jgi:integrative and conjugative element protein (TIGR02256 family)
MRRRGYVRFARPNGGRLEIGEAALAQFATHRQRHAKNSESGGVLLGRLVEHSSDAVIDEVSTPTPTDGWGRFNFFRRRKPAQLIVDKAWKDSSSTRIYLGEWHSHPEDVPTPSGHDLKEWTRITAESTFEQDSLFFIIVGRVETRVWEYSKGAESPVALELLKDT